MEVIVAGKCYVEQILARGRVRVRRLLSSGVAGTKRVREPGHARAPASTVMVAKEPDFQRDRARAGPRVDARPLLVVLS